MGLRYEDVVLGMIAQTFQAAEEGSGSEDTQGGLTRPDAVNIIVNILTGRAAATAV